MSSFSADATSEIKKNRARKIAGGYNSIPFGHKRLQHYIPGIQHSNYVILSANSGIGKSKFAKNTYVFKPFDFVHNNPSLGIKFTTLYFLLEEPGKAFMQSLMCYKLRVDHGIRISIKELRSQLDPDDPTAVVDQDIIDKVDAMEPYLKAFEESIILIDDIRKPYAIYKKCQEVIEELGDWTMAPKKVYDPTSKTTVTKLVRDKFVMDDPNHYVQIVIDHISLIEPEKGQDLFEAIRTLSSVYLTQLKNRYHAAILNIQQQSSAKETQQYTYKGASIESKLEPSLDGLGDCKLTQRDADEILGLFAPDRFEIGEHRGYDIARLGDNYRSASLLKTRDGEANLRLGFFFDGASNLFIELPKSGDMKVADYDKVKKLAGRK